MKLKSLDPRTRLILGVLTLLLVIFTSNLKLLCGESVLLLLGIFVFGMAGSWLKSLKISAPMVGMVFLVGLISFPLLEALEMVVRFQALLLASFLLFGSLRPRSWKGHFRRMGVPYAFCFMLVTAMRYVPLMGRRLRATMEAQDQGA